MGQAGGDGRRVHVHRIHRERVGIAVDRDTHSRTTKQGNPVELFLTYIADVILQLGKLHRVVRPVGICLGDILRQHGQLTHAIESLLDFLDEPILRLGEGDRVGDVGHRRRVSVDLSPEFDAHRQAGGIVLWRDYPGSGSQPCKGLC